MIRLTKHKDNRVCIYAPRTKSLIVFIDVTGNESSSKGIVDVYDAFGLQAQTLQGADRLASSLTALVIIPDLCKGVVADPAWFPPDTDEKKDAAQKFRAPSILCPRYFESWWRRNKGGHLCRGGGFLDFAGVGRYDHFVCVGDKDARR